MPTLLHVDSSPLGEHSVSRRLSAEFVARWRRAHPDGGVIVRDLNRTDIPTIDAMWLAAADAPKDSRSAEQNAALALSDQFLAELFAADEYVIAVPMHNWGPSASFKLWADYLVRYGETIAYTPDGPRGMLRGKRATFVITSGGIYRAGTPGEKISYLEPWLRTFFAFLGVEDVHFVVADGALDLKTGKIDSDDFYAPHLRTIDRQLGRD